MLMLLVLAATLVLTGACQQAPAVVSVSIDGPSDLAIEVGDTHELTATITTTGGASQALTWTSSNPATATVTSTGVVTGITTGDTTITASSDFDNTKQASVTVTVVKAPTEVSGIIWSDTTWALSDSPYRIVGPVQIDVTATLTIEPGVEVMGGSIQTWGRLVAHGTPVERITFSGVEIVPGTSSSSTRYDISIDYARITAGSTLFEPTGSGHYGTLSLRNSTVSTPLPWVYLWYPQSDVEIERNVFESYTRFSIGHNVAKVIIRNNHFRADGEILNWAAYGEPTVVELNTFSDSRFRVGLSSGYTDVALTAVRNYWGTVSPAEIEEMILDRNDGLEYAGYVPYEPFLAEPHPDTPE